jgi:formylglycine-generating enzyme required for sulfatase activity
VTGYYSGDEIYGAGDYEIYDLNGNNRITWDGNYFIIENGFDEHPVVEVTWFGANAYAEYYSWRLPTEEEWEKAARGMTGYEYPWGDNLSGDRANYYNSGDPWDNGTTPVGYYNGENNTTDSPSAYGCYDMCGNVYDWTDSWNSSDRVLRGGSWNEDDKTSFRSWSGNHNNPTFTDSYTGFRCARTVE